MPGERNTVDFPTNFGPATTRMPPLPNGRGKRKSTWKKHEKIGKRSWFKFDRTYVDGARGSKGQRHTSERGNRATLRKIKARRTAGRSRRLNRGV